MIKPLKKYVLSFFLLITGNLCAQSDQQMKVYNSFIETARKYAEQENYERAAATYTKAFAALGNKGFGDDRYAASLVWMKVKNYDSCFFQLFRLAEKTDYLDHPLLHYNQPFKEIENDIRWEKLNKLVNPNNDVFNDSLYVLLNEVHKNDQRFRKQIGTITSKYGWESKQFDELNDSIRFHDSINEKIVLSVIDKYGWLTKNNVGKNGNKSIWLVIQHASNAIQEKYFPVMQQAVNEGKASKIDLAYLEDRILMHNGKKQKYGTQFKVDPATGEQKLWDVEDPDNLNKRRQEIGLWPY